MSSRKTHPPDDFDPELRTLARLLPKSVVNPRLMKVDRAMSHIRRKIASKKVPESRLAMTSHP